VREVIVETVGKSIKTISVGKEKKPKKSKPLIPNINCSSTKGTMSRGRLSSIFDSVDIKSRRCWKIKKKGLSAPRKNWQRHGERQPSRRRNRWGHVRHWITPSVRPLNEMGLCIYPYTSVEEMDFWESGKSELLEELLNIE